MVSTRELQGNSKEFFGVPWKILTPWSSLERSQYTYIFEKCNIVKKIKIFENVRKNQKLSKKLFK